MSETTRRFHLHLRDGRVFHGARFPSGQVAVNHPQQPDQPYIMTLALDLDALLSERHPEDPLHEARVEWVDGDSE